MPIRQLSQSLINKIAAGEVIERPASVVKELMENAVDAGATRIDVSARAGGGELMRVVDNGGGIASDELSLAVAAHATSKIVSADDLFSVHTLGFRGEAIASIAEISRFSIRSRTADSDGGAEIEVVGGKSDGVSPCGCPTGTTVEVANLFFNTPVRRKFLRTTQTEFGHISEAFCRIALINPNIHFTLRHNDRSVFDLPVTDAWRERIGRVVGRQVTDHLIPVESTHGDVRLSGFVAHPSQSRSNTRMQYVFLNGRHIRDRALQHALTQAYRGLLMTGRHPIAFLALELPADLVDVNVHPTKLEVRFQDSSKLYSQLLSTLRTKFLSSDLTTRVETPDEDDPTGAHDEAETGRLRQQVVDWAKGEVDAWPSSSSGAPSRAGEPVANRSASGGSRGFGSAGGAGPLRLSRLDRPWTPADRQTSGAVSDGSETEAAASESNASPPGPTYAPRALQIHNRYLVTENDEGVVVIDQHALHERILYDHLLARVEAGSIEAQNLLVPEPVDLSPAEMAAALEHRELLGQLGMKIEPFGGDTILLAAYPAMLANISPVDVLRGLLDQILAGAKLPDRTDLLDELLHSIACKAAIKAGDHLAPEEIESLLEQSHLVDDPTHCPHGRPAALIFSREELDKKFKRL